jgi:hypothetical protein
MKIVEKTIQPRLCKSLLNPTLFVANTVVPTRSSKLTLIHRVCYSASKLILLINHALWAGLATDTPPEHIGTSRSVPGIPQECFAKFLG